MQNKKLEKFGKNSTFESFESKQQNFKLWTYSKPLVLMGNG